MKRIFSAAMPVAGLLIFNLVFCAALSAAQVELYACFAAPYGYYKALKSLTTFRIGVAGAPATNVVFNGGNTTADPATVLYVRNNGLHPWQSGTPSGGNLMINGDFNVLDASAQSLFYIDSVNNRVGIGTSSPGATLEVRPNNGFGAGITALDQSDIKSLVIAGHENTVDYTKPWVEMRAQFNAPDSTIQTVANPLNLASFGGVGNNSLSKPYTYYWTTTHLDGAPVLFQSINKSASGVTAGGGYGQVVIRGYYNSATTGPNPRVASNAVLVVGEPNPVVYAPPYVTAPSYTPQCRGWSFAAFSSRDYKQDIKPLTLADYQGYLCLLAGANLVGYHYKGESVDSKLHTGFVTEEAPREIVTEDGIAISLQDEGGLLLASLKAVKMENDGIAKRIEKLKQCASQNASR